MEARKIVPHPACRCLWLWSPFYAASGRRQGLVGRGLALAEFDVATATVDVVFFVDGRRFGLG